LPPCRIIAAVRPALQENVAGIDVVAGTEKSERALGVERPHGLLVNAVAIGIAMTEAWEAMRLAARAETSGSSAR
jgi:hypothetical protein